MTTPEGLQSVGGNTAPALRLSNIWLSALAICGATCCCSTAHSMRAAWARACMLAGPQPMKLTWSRSRMRCSDLCTSVGSASPWMMLRMEMYLVLVFSLLLACADTMTFLLCSSRRITSTTVVFRIWLPACTCAGPAVLHVPEPARWCELYQIRCAQHAERYACECSRSKQRRRRTAMPSTESGV